MDSEYSSMPARSSPLGDTMRAPTLEVTGTNLWRLRDARDPRSPRVLFQKQHYPLSPPPHTSHKLQPCDVGMVTPLKTAYRSEPERLFQGGANTVCKQNLTCLYRGEGVHEEEYHKSVGQSPQSDTETPSQSTVPRADEIRVGSCHQDEITRTSVTTVSAEGLVLLQNLIKQDANALHEASIRCLERHV
ncbi:DDE superfamily endonuclease protein [Rutstroemia sp. NJR-2017a WRK4]|nr:DDE superfamily endonuclease protein [Rutstroemia sp. NJR-2017a WRK4]